MTLQSANDLLRSMWADIQRASQEQALAKITANPDKHRMTRLMARGSNTGYRYYAAGERIIGKTRKEKIRFCRATHKNAAGVFLIWRQVDRYKLVRGKWSWHEAQRFDFQWAPTKAEAKDLCRRKAEKTNAT